MLPWLLRPFSTSSGDDIVKTKLICFLTVVAGLAMSSVTAMAQEERTQGQGKPRAVKELPQGLTFEKEAKLAGETPGAIVIRGSAQQSVAAGELFLIDVYLTRPAA